MATLELVKPARSSKSAQSSLHMTNEGQSWLQVLPHLDPVYGGLSAVVPRLAQELATECGMQVRVAAFCSPGEERFAAGDPNISIWPLARSAWTSSRTLKVDFEAQILASGGIHIHGLWESSTLLAARAARKAGVPYVLSAHGMLDPWALANKRWKKLIYAALFEHRNVRGAACLHALTRAEAEDYRRFGCKGPIAVIPNGVEADPSATPSQFLAAYPLARGKDLVLFLGRIHFKKGVDLLVSAWAELASALPNALLVLAGPDSEGTLEKVRATVQRSNLEDRVLFTGMLDGPMKWSALAAATCFVLPSYSEGLSVAVLEALAMGVPVIVSAQCNVPEIEEHGAGWLIQTELPSLTGAVRDAVSCSADRRAQLSTNARHLAHTNFSWSSVAERMAEIYRWLNDGPRPVKTELLGEKA